MDAVKDKIHQILSGISEDASPHQNMQPVVTGIYDPPSYAVRILLCGLAGFQNAGPDEKQVWSIRLRYKEVGFLVRDWKRTSWSVDCASPAAEAVTLANTVVEKIKSACRLLDKVLAEELKHEIEVSNFFLHNSYYKIRPLYEYFRGQGERIDREKKEFVAKNQAARVSAQREGNFKSGLELLARSLAEQSNQLAELERTLSYNAAAMIVFYFAYTELLLDILHAFEPFRGQTFQEFRSAKWSDRFKSVLSVSKDKELARIYQALLEIKQNYRDAVVHGYGDAEALLVPLKGIGLVPISYEVASEAPHFSWLPVSEELALRAMQAFKDFDDWLARDEYAGYVVLYAKTGFEIPFQPDRLEKIQGWMKGHEAFKEALEQEAEARGYFDNTYG